MNTISAQDAGERLDALIDQVVASREPLLITVTWTPKPEPMLMRASPPARLGKEKLHESQTPQPRADHPQAAHR